MKKILFRSVLGVLVTAPTLVAAALGLMIWSQATGRSTWFAVPAAQTAAVPALAGMPRALEAPAEPEVVEVPPVPPGAADALADSFETLLAAFDDPGAAGSGAGAGLVPPAPAEPAVQGMEEDRSQLKAVLGELEAIIAASMKINEALLKVRLEEENAED